MNHLLRVLIVLTCGPLVLPAAFCACADDSHEQVTIGSEEHHEEGAPDEHSHDADCPTSWEAVVSPSVSLDLIPLLVWLMPPVIAKVPPSQEIRFFSADAVARHVDPPLYLSHCALVI